MKSSHLVRAWRSRLHHPSVYFGVSSVALLWLAVILLIDTEQRAHREAIRLRTTNLAYAAEDSVSRSIVEIDATLRQLAQVRASDPPGSSWSGLLRRNFGASGEIMEARVLDTRGQVIATSRSLATSGPPSCPGQWEELNAPGAADALWISRPLAIGAGRWAIQLSRSLREPDGRFAGAIVVCVDTALFSRFYQHIDLGADGGVSLIGRDGIVRASSNPMYMPPGSSLASADILTGMAGAQEGSLALERAGSGSIASFRWLPGLPLAVIVTSSEQQPAGFTGNRRAAYLLAAAVLTFIATIGVILSLRRTRRLVEARRQLAAKSSEFEITLERMSQGIMMIDAQDRIRVLNNRCIEMLGLPRRLAHIGGSYRAVTRFLEERGEFTSSAQSRLLDFLRLPNQSNWIDCYERVRPDGTALEVRNEPLPDGGFIRTLTDITERRMSEARIVHLARHDGLTGIANRALFRQRLDEAVEHLEMGEAFALLMIDLDRFKPVNDTFGHLAGDAVLKEIARRIAGCTRATDIVARLGGDEFAVIQLGTGVPQQAIALAERICRACALPFPFEGHDVLVGASIGIALAPHDGNRGEDLLRAADLALYSVKAAGRNSFQLYSHQMHAAQRARIALEADLRRAVLDQQFELHYQPIFAIATGEAAAYEALIRWKHPERGMVSPGEFIPLAEETGLIDPIGKWVLFTACRQIAAISATARVAVNLSPVQFRNPGLVETVRQALADADLPPHRLEVEITESVLLQDDQMTLQHLEALRDLGVHITMDDFGTGYSSLSYLLSYPIQSLKIDRSFVMALGQKASCEAIVRAITTLASSLGLSTTAEGVETAEQLDLLREAGCIEAQGFYLARPAPLAAPSPSAEPSASAPQLPAKRDRAA